MADRHADFDARTLFERKDNHGGYRICPFCGSALEGRLLDNLKRLVCSSQKCDFIYYHNPVPAAGAIVVENNRILMVKRAHPPKVGYWCIPAGFMEWHEHPTQTAVRELHEETGLKVELDGLFEIYTGTDDPRSNAVLILYLGHTVGGKLKAADDALDVCFFEFDDLPSEIAFESHNRAIDDYQRRQPADR